MPRSLGFVSIAITIAASRIAVAQAPANGRSITLAEAIHTALRQNPDLAVAQTLIDSARAEHTIARALPNPTLAGTPNSPYQYSVSIPLDITPQRYYRTQAASIGERATTFDRGDLERQTTLTVARAFYDAVLVDEKAKLALSRRDVMQQLLRADSLRFKAGEVPERNLARSEVELIRADADVARTRVAVAQGRVTLGGAMGLAHVDTSLTPAGTLEYRPLDARDDSLLILARSQRPDLHAANARASAATTARHAASALLVPTPDLALVRQYGAPFDNGHYYAVGLTFELPSLNLYRGQRERAEAGANAADASARRVNAQVERDVVGAMTDFRAHRALVEQYRSGLIGKVDADVGAVQYAYAHGASSLLEVLDAIQVQQQARSEYLDAMHDYWISAFAVNAAVGADVFGIAP